MINRVILTGRLTSNIELRRTNDGTPYTFFTIAVNRMGNDNTDFIGCVAWKKTATLMDEYLRKGSLIGVEGRLEVFSQQKDGRYETRTNVQVSTITFLEPKSQSQRKVNEEEIGYQSQDEEPISFADENVVDQSETTPISQSTDETDNEFEKAEEVNANNINLDDIKF